MERQIEVWIDQYLVQPVHVALKILILVLLDDRTYPMAVVCRKMPIMASPRSTLHSERLKVGVFISYFSYSLFYDRGIFFFMGAKLRILF